MGLIKFLKKLNLLSLQSLVLGKSYSYLIMTEKQLIREAQRIVKSDLKIINDCTRLINSTIKPNVFFMRYDLLKEKANHLVKFEPYIKMTGTPPHKMVSTIETKEQLAIADFLKRYYLSVDSKARTLKTEKSRNNQYTKFYDSLQPYYNKMNDENKNYVNGKKPIQQHINEITFIENAND